MSAFAGKWEVKFTNGMVRTYEIQPDGTVECIGGPNILHGKIVAAPEGYFELDFGGSSNLNRIKLGDQNRFDLDLYLPKANYKAGRPTTATAVGKRIEKAPPASAVATTTAPEQRPGNAPTPSAAPTRQLVLAPGWDTPMQGGGNTMDDLGKLFAGVAKPGVRVESDPTINVYDGVPYLTPLPEALKALRITNHPASRNQITCPGLPRGSLFYYAVDGRFEGKFNLMYVVVDRADQVVSIQLVDETPANRPDHPIGILAGTPTTSSMRGQRQTVGSKSSTSCTIRIKTYGEFWTAAQVAPGRTPE